MFQKLVPTVIRMAEVVVNEMKAKFSDSQYDPPVDLSVGWIASHAFRAAASIRDSIHHGITISYGVPIAIYKDAVLLPQMCLRHFVEPKYRELFSLVEYGDGPEQILPKDLSDVEIKQDFFTVSLGWLYLHEQAHLFQNHGNIFAQRTGQTSRSGLFECLDAWYDDNPASEVTGYEAWLSHAFELSADYEGVNLILQYMMLRDGGTLRKSSIWVLVAGLTCLFRRFYGMQRPPQPETALGTHPSPAIRMANAYQAILSTLNHPATAKYLSWGTGEEIQRVMNHAHNVANLYMEIAYGQAQLPEFMLRVVDDSEPTQKYRSELKSVWNTVHPEVLASHAGYGPGSVMPQWL